MARLFTPAVRDRQLIDDQILAFIFPGADTLRFILRNMILLHESFAYLRSNTAPGFIRLIGIMETPLRREETFRLLANKCRREEVFNLLSAR